MTAAIEGFQHSHLPGVIKLCEAQAWPSFPEDPERALRALTAPGVTTVVALEGDAGVGFAQLLSDGEIQAYLAATHRRGEGIGTALIEQAIAIGGGGRIDLLTDDEATGFYDRLAHRTKNGYRLYPPLDQPLPDGLRPHV
jgi:GNAT superfamily N-acetyltransferase